MAENFVDVSEVFNGWQQSLTVTRTSGAYVNGRWVDGADAVTTFLGVVQNATPEDLKVLPEGNRTEEAIKIHTTYQLIAQIETTEKGDVISYNGENWLVYNVASRKIGGYYKAIAIKVE